MAAIQELRVPAIEVTQGTNRVLYTFAVDGKQLPSFATISRIKRKSGTELEGYQRPEVVSHIGEIKSYLESDSPMIPNAIVVAFDGRVRFEATAPVDSDAAYSRHGMLVIPIDDSLMDADKPGFVVDGQQRLAAIRDAHIGAFPICVSAFITDEITEQKEQFILVNSTKPLPKGLIYELLPGTHAKLPSLLQKRRFPAYLVERLNHDETSPLRGKVRTPTTPDGQIKDNSLLKMLENSLNDGVLYRYRDATTGEGDVEKMLHVLGEFWGAVADIFPDAWSKPARRSRLVHGAGVVSLGFVMDAISDRYRREGIPTRQQFAEDLKPLETICCWTNGHWEFGPGQLRKWNEVQNTSKDIQLLTNYLLVKYKSLVWDRAQAQN